MRLYVVLSFAGTTYFRVSNIPVVSIKFLYICERTIIIH
jgi:hypothetical protein